MRNSAKQLSSQEDILKNWHKM